jgi:molybdate/tungstate transport system substrate-binding protein
MRLIRIVLTTTLVLITGCDSREEKTRVRLFMADSLIRPFGMVSGAFEQQKPGVEIVHVASGSVLAARKLSEANDQADLLAVADYMVIDKLLRPEHADWYICFATNEVGIAYTDASKDASDLTEANWFEVLARDGVKVAAANPNHDPGGYWTELCWRLADLHYPETQRGGSITEAMTAKCGERESRRSDAQQLLQLVEAAGGVDYAFVYRSQALQHNLPFLRLPPEISLSDVRHLDFYRKVAIELPGKKRGTTIEKRGDAIVYAITIPKSVKHADLAAAYITFLLGPEGRSLLEAEYMTLLDRPWTYDPDRLPASLRDIAGTRDQLSTTTAPGTPHE